MEEIETVEDALLSYGIPKEQVLLIVEQLDKTEKTPLMAYETRQILEFLKNEQILQEKRVQEKLYVLIKNHRAKTLQNINTVLQANGINSQEIFKKAGTILTTALSQDVDYVMQVFKKNDLNSELILKKCSRLFFTNIFIERIDKIIKVLKENEIELKTIEECTSILVHNSDK